MDAPNEEPVVAPIPYTEIGLLTENLTEDGVLTFVQKQRLAALPEVFDDHKLRLKLLDDLAKTALGQKRISADTAIGASTVEAVEAMTKLLCSIKTDPFVGNGGVRKPANVPTIVPLYEETSIELSNLTLADITTD